MSEGLRNQGKGIEQLIIAGSLYDVDRVNGVIRPADSLKHPFSMRLWKCEGDLGSAMVDTMDGRLYPICDVIESCYGLTRVTTSVSYLFADTAPDDSMKKAYNKRSITNKWGVVAVDESLSNYLGGEEPLVHIFGVPYRLSIQRGRMEAQERPYIQLSDLIGYKSNKGNRVLGILDCRTWKTINFQHMEYYADRQYFRIFRMPFPQEIDPIGAAIVLNAKKTLLLSEVGFKPGIIAKELLLSKSVLRIIERNYNWNWSMHI